MQRMCNGCAICRAAPPMPDVLHIFPDEYLRISRHACSRAPGGVLEPGSPLLADADLGRSGPPRATARLRQTDFVRGPTTRGQARPTTTARPSTATQAERGQLGQCGWVEDGGQAEDGGLHLEALSATTSAASSPTTAAARTSTSTQAERGQLGHRGQDEHHGQAGARGQLDDHSDPGRPPRPGPGGADRGQLDDQGDPAQVRQALELGSAPDSRSEGLALALWTAAKNLPNSTAASGSASVS